MVNYRRDYTPGATYFFTATLKNRHASYFTEHITALGQAFRDVRTQRPFITHAIIVLPEHLHVIWELPHQDYDYSLRWRLIKTQFTRSLITLGAPLIKNKRGEYSLWQGRFWEHRIRHERDLCSHIDYIHYNPVKHGYVKRAMDWPYSSIHRYINQGLISANWHFNGESSDILSHIRE